MMLLKGKGLSDEVYKIIDYIVEENWAYRKQNGPPKLTDALRMRLSTLARKMEPGNFESVCTIFQPETVLGWYRKILKMAHTYKGGGSQSGGRPSTLPEIERKLVEIASENRRWGYGKLHGRSPVGGALATM